MVIAVLLLVLLFTAGLLATTYIHIPSEKFSSWLQSFYLKDSPRSPLVMNSSIETSSTSPIASYGEMGAYKRAELKGVFATFDKNGDGFITKQELRESLKNIGILMSEKEVKEMVAKVDSNGDGLIDFEEFCVLCETTWCSSSVSTGDQEIKESGDSSSGSGDDNKEMDLKEAFDVFDKDKDGLISVEELRSVLSSLGLKEGGRVEDCKEMIRKVDMDGDGMVNFDEFKKMMMRSGGGHKLVSAY